MTIFGILTSFNLKVCFKRNDLQHILNSSAFDDAQSIASIHRKSSVVTYGSGSFVMLFHSA